MKKKKKKSNKINLIICGIAFVFMLFYVYFVDGFDNLAASLKQFNIFYLFLGILLMIVYWLLEALGLFVIIEAVAPGQKFYKTLIVSIMGQYFNCITPSSTGGQPMQVYYFSQFDVPVSSSMTALLGKFIIYQFTLTVYSVVVLLLRFDTFCRQYAPLMAFVIVGFVINTAIIVGLFMLAFFVKPVKKIVHLILRLLKKLRIIKSQQSVDDKYALACKTIDEYHENFRYLRTKPLLIAKMLLYSAIQLLVYFSMSAVIYLGFGLSGTDYFTIISCQAFVFLISGFVPLPGALGAAEGSYSLFFSDIFTNGVNSFVGISTFIWRLLTFYLPIIVGLILSLFLGKIMNMDYSKSDDPIELSENDIKGDDI